MSATMHQAAIAEYPSVEQGLVPLGEGAPPFLVVVLPSNMKEADQGIEKSRYGALARFKNAPHDLVIVIASDTDGKFGIDGVYWTIDH